MNERESIGDFNEQLDSEIEETFTPPGPGFWKTSQIESDYDETVDFDAAPKKRRSQDVHLSISKQRKSRLQRSNTYPASAK